MRIEIHIALVVVSSLSFATASRPSNGMPLHFRGQAINSTSMNSQFGTRDLPTGTCDAQTPCANKACCGSNNLCGYAAKECGSGCRFNCDAKAECGPYAPTNSQKCPLNVCCSKFGFCGSTDEFCTWSNTDDPLYPACDTKYGGCGAVKRPGCGGGNSVAKRTIGYYESWSNTRKCSNVAPEDLNLDGFSHINFAFSFFDPSSFQITPMDANAASLYSRFTALKSKRSGLQAWISVGGWSFTDPGSTQKAFSVMTSSKGNRASFISGLLKFMTTYGFDGVDLDWEYPGADDRGGVAADTANYVSFVQELKAAFGSKYGISMTLPTSFWYLQHFDLPGIQQHIDWFNLMAYDLHGVWDKDSKWVGPYIAPHTNITEIDLGLDLLWRAGVTPDKVILGQGWYGRSFTLASPSCSTPNGVCQFLGPANPGPCSNAGGILNNQEIIDIISKNNLNPTWDKTAGVKWITWNSNQWVSYDDADTFKQKKDFANSRCLGGLMVWAMDQVDQKASNGLSPIPGISSDQQSSAKQLSDNQQAGMTCRTSDCGAGCPKGSHEVTQTNGQPGSLSTAARCPKGKYQSVCCDAGTTMGKCQWRGYRGAALSCMGGCAEGETEVTTNKNNHDKKKGDQTCNGGVQSYCCAGFKPAPTKQQLEKDAADAAKAASEAAAAQAALDIAAKAFCRIAVPALLAPLELLEDLIPIFGEIADLAEIAATPAIIQACVKGVEKEGKAEFKVFGKKHTLSMGEPSEAPKDRPPKTSHESAKTSSKDDSCTKPPKAGDLEKRVGCRKTVTSYSDVPASEIYDRHVVECPLAQYPQACQHYKSAIQYHANPAFNPVTCSIDKRDRDFNPEGEALAIWSKEHNPVWRTWMRRPQGNCQRDEWPPAEFWQGGDGQVIRYNHRKDNSGAGQKWSGFCTDWSKVPTQCVPGSEREIRPPNERSPVTISCRKQVTLKVMSMSFPEDEDQPLAQLNQDGLVANECYPQMLVNDPSFAILNSDPYFLRNARTPYAAFADDHIDPALINGRTAPYPKKSGGQALMIRDDYSVDSMNVSRRLTEEEFEVLQAKVGIVERIRSNLKEKMQRSGRIQMTESPYSTEATATAVAASTVQTRQGSVAVSRSGLKSPPTPEFTGSAQQNEDLKF